ncbi:hypothetical protein ACWEO2_17645 [Nocardia sp. NPDC004278]
MTTMSFRGEFANLRVAEWELGEDPVLRDVCRVTVKEVSRERSALRHGVLAEMAITITSGAVTTAISEAIRLVINRARDRGDVQGPSETDNEEPEQN